MKKILLISNKVYHYRVSIYNYFNTVFNKHGYELIVLTNHIQKDNPHNIQFKLIVKPFHFFDYRKIILDIKPDVVIYFLHLKDLILWPLILWLKFKRIKIIYWGHGIYLEDTRNSLKRSLFHFLHSMSDALILYSENEKKYVSNQYWHKTFIANNTLNFDDIPTINDSKNDIKGKYKIPFKRIVLFVARITPEKRIDDLLDAAQLFNEGTGVVVVGGGLNLQQEQKIQKSHNIFYLGELYDKLKINQVFKMADVFCIPGAIGLGINQAFYWGLPVVTEDLHHAPEKIYLKNNINGFIFKQGNIQMLAEKINYILISPSLYDAFSARAKEEIMRNGNIDTMCNGFISAIGFLENRKDK